MRPTLLSHRRMQFVDIPSTVPCREKTKRDPAEHPTDQHAGRATKVASDPNERNGADGGPPPVERRRCRRATERV